MTGTTRIGEDRETGLREAVDAESAPTTRDPGSLPGVLLAATGLALGGPAGIVTGGALVGCWLLFPIHSVAGLGVVFVFAVGGAEVVPATGIGLAGIALALLGTAVRTDSPPVTGALIALLTAALFGLVGLTAAVQGPVGAVALLAVVGAGASYFIHRYSLVRVAGAEDPPGPTSRAHGRTDEATTSRTDDTTTDGTTTGQ